MRFSSGGPMNYMGLVSLHKGYWHFLDKTIFWFAVDETR